MAVILRVEDRRARPQVIAILGVGLIGTAVLRCLTQQLRVSVQPIPTAWENAAMGGLKPLADRCLTTLKQLQEREARSIPLKVLWSAGRAWFGASQAEVDAEFRSFVSAIEMCSSLSKQGVTDDVSFALLSSAGGLFEGRRLIDSSTPPRPSRPYGRLKLMQEEVLASARRIARKRIVRLTSVYGYVRPGVRSGVIGTMVANGISGRVTEINGRLNTLRDFVWVEDLARLLADLLTQGDEHETRVSLVASSKPSSLFEVQKVVEKAIGRRLYVCYQQEASNAADITVARGAGLALRESGSLMANVRRIHLDLVGQGVSTGGPV